jgi:large repetitive protein
MAQPTFDASASGNTGSAAANSLTVSHSIGSGSNRLVLVGVHIANRGSATVTSVTYNGTSMTSLGSAESSGGWYTELFLLKQVNLPTAGTYNVIISVSATRRIVGTVLSYADVDQTTSTGTVVTNTGTGTSATGTCSLGADDVAADFATTRGVTAQSQTLTTTLGQQQTNETTSATKNINVHGGTSTNTTAARSWTLGFSAEWSIVVAPIKGIVSGSTYTKTGQVLSA